MITLEAISAFGQSLITLCYVFLMFSVTIVCRNGSKKEQKKGRLREIIAIIIFS